MKKETISIVVACYNEEESLPLFYEAVTKVLESIKKINYEIIFVNDGSKDKTLKVIKDLHVKDKNIRYVSFSRNFGKEAAMLAGLEYAKGDYVALMDADLQDPPELIPKMFDILECERDYRLMRRNVVNAILSLEEYNRFSKGLFSFVGFNTKWLEFENKERIAGETKWSFFSLFKYAIEGLVAFSTVPLTIAAIIGILFCLIAFIMIIVIIVKTLIFGDPTSGWPSMICIIFLVSGIQLFCLGIIGEYLSKTYLETKKRPIYIIKETDEN